MVIPGHLMVIRLVKNMIRMRKKLNKDRLRSLESIIQLPCISDRP